MNSKNTRPVNNGKQSKAVNTDSFLEALRDLGSDFGSSISNDLVQKGSRDIYENFFPFKKSDKGESQNYFQNPQERGENVFYQRKIRQAEIVHKQEVLLFSNEQKETQKQVAALQDEIRQLAKATGDLAREANQAAINDVPVAGKYHQNFFEILLKVIKNLRSQIQESSFWLSSWNKKAQKKNFFWSKAKKSGTSFLLHHDRAVATQTG